MGGLGKEREFYMYDYVEDKEFLRRAQADCSQMMHELEEELREEGINTQFFLVGSGARNMVMQNGNGPIDFDYNLNILSCDDIDDCRFIKEEVRKAFNRVLRNNGLCDVSDSTIPLTTKPIYFTDKPDIKFTMDVCIVRNRNGKWERLKHEKTGIWQNDSYYWNVAPNSRNYVEKSKAIKDVPGWWEVVRQQYKDIKNRYLSKQDNDHPSFVCYIEAVNNVYNQMRQKGLL